MWKLSNEILDNQIFDKYKGNSMQRMFIGPDGNAENVSSLQSLIDNQK